MFQLTVSDDIINESWTPMIFHCNSNAVYTDCTSKTLRVINAKYFWNNWLIAKYTLIDYIANKQVWDKLVELRVTLLNEKVTEILKHKPEELTDTKGVFFTPDMARCGFTAYYIIKTRLLKVWEQKIL